MASAVNDAELAAPLGAYLDAAKAAKAAEKAKKAAEKAAKAAAKKRRQLKRCILAPGNGCTNVAAANWYSWAAKNVSKLGIFEEPVALRNFPDPRVARRSVWLPFLVDELKADEHTVLIGHSSGAEAALRLLETTKLAGVVLVAACHTDLGEPNERASGYYPPSGGEWQWKAIAENAGFILQFHSTDDPFIPIAEARHVRDQLTKAGANLTYCEHDDKSHFFAPFDELLVELKRRVAEATTEGAA